MLCEGLDVAEQRVALLLLVRPVLDDRVADQFRPDAKDTGKFITERTDLLEHGRGGYPVHAATAPLFRVAATEEITAPRLPEEFLGKFDDVRVHVQNHLTGHPLYEIPRLVAQTDLLFCQ